MITPLLYVDTQKLKGELVSLRKVVTPFSILNNPTLKNTPSKSCANLINKVLTDYKIYKPALSKSLGVLSLDTLSGKDGSVVLKYHFQDSLSEVEKANALSTFLNYIKHFYGWNFKKDKTMAISPIFQEIKTRSSYANKDLSVFLKAGFKISFVEHNLLVLRHRLEDHTGLEYEDILGLSLLDLQTVYSILEKRLLFKLKKSVLEGESLGGSDIETLKWYLRHDNGAWNYYLLLIRENPRLYLDYARLVNTMKMISL